MTEHTYTALPWRLGEPDEVIAHAIYLPDRDEFFAWDPTNPVSLSEARRTWRYLRAEGREATADGKPTRRFRPEAARIVMAWTEDHWQTIVRQGLPRDTSAPK